MIRNVNFQKLAVDHQLISEADMARLSGKYGDDAFAVLMHLVRGAVATRNFLGKLWGDSIGVAYVDLEKSIFQNPAVQQLSQEDALKLKVIPIYQLGASITIASANPTDESLLAELQRILLKPVSLVFSFPDDIEDAIMIQYQSGSVLGGLMEKIASNPLFKATGTINAEQLKGLAGDQAIIQFAQALVLLAVKERSSDIHIEPAEDVVRVRFRIDGVLHERLKLETELLPPLITR